MRNSKENRKKELNRKNKTNKRNKIIRKDAQKGTTVIEFNLSKAVIMLIIIGVVLAGLLTKEIVTTIAEVNKTELLANEEEIDIHDLKEVNGDLGCITSAEAKVKTGVGPFDENDEPGNDSSENNNIVRSFDQITWTYELTFGLKPVTTETSLRGGVIEVEASLPTTLSNLVDSLRIVKHDYNNILQTINGYIVTKEYKGLEEHFKQLYKESNCIATTESVNPSVINQPAVYAIVGSKYNTAMTKNIKFDVDVETTVTIYAGKGYFAPKGETVLLKRNATEMSEKVGAAIDLALVQKYFVVDTDSYDTYDGEGDETAPAITGVNVNDARKLVTGDNVIPVEITYVGSTGKTVVDTVNVTIVGTAYVDSTNPSFGLTYEGSPITELVAGKTYYLDQFNVAESSYKEMAKGDVVVEITGVARGDGNGEISGSSFVPNIYEGAMISQ